MVAPPQTGQVYSEISGVDMSPKALVTGSAGMLASDLIRSLQTKMDVTGTDCRPTDGLRGAFRSGDLSDSHFVKSLVAELTPDFIFHTAAMTNVDGCEKNPELAFKINCQATEQLVKAANQANAMLIFFSTDYVFDGKKKEAYIEEDPMKPLSVYGETKKNAETYIRQHAKRFVIFRVSWLYGMQGPSFPRTILEKAREVPQFEIVQDQVGRPTYTKDLALCLAEIFDKFGACEARLNRETFHLTNDGTVSWADFAEFILAHSTGPKPPVRKIMTPPGHRPAKRPVNSVLSLEKSRTVLGVSLRPWQDAVIDFIHDYEGKGVQ